MQRQTKLMDMLTGYAAAHQHPFNVAVHLIGIPTIMLGVFIVLALARVDVAGVTVSGAYLAALVLFIFYLTLDWIFSFFFLLYALPVAYFATIIAAQPIATSGAVAAAAFFGGYAAQFAGHAVERSAPVILKHPVQANLAAPFFTVVEIFKILNLRDELFDEIQQQIGRMNATAQPPDTHTGRQA